AEDGIRDKLVTGVQTCALPIWSGDLIRYQELKGIPGIGSCKNVALTTPLLSDPGDRWEYGIGIDWAGKMVEAVSGTTLGNYVKRSEERRVGKECRARVEV